MSTLLTGTATPVQTPTVTEQVDPPDGGDLTGWFCVATRPFACYIHPDFVAEHMTVCHLILCWPESDDPKMLSAAAFARDKGRDPKIVDYQRSLGPCISFYEWERHGRPAHNTPGAGEQGPARPL